MQSRAPFLSLFCLFCTASIKFNKLTDFVFFFEGGETFFKFGKRNFDGDKIDFGVGLIDKLDKIIPVAIHGDKFTAALPWL